MAVPPGAVPSYIPFEDQPGQYVFIDITFLKNESLVQLCNSLKAVLRLNYLSDCGYPRIPFLGLSIWNGTNFQTLFDFQSLNVEINEAFFAIENLAKATYVSAVPETVIFKQFLQNIVTQNRNTLNYAKAKPELTVLTASELFSSNFVDLLRLEDVDANLSSMFEQVKLFHLAYSIAAFEQSCGFSNNGHLVLSTRSLDCHSVSFDLIFRQWLTNKSINCSQLQLTLPALYNSCIHCDVLEILLSPDDLLSKAAKTGKIPIRNLEACYRFPSKRFSHDMLYGCPLKIVPTSCWKMDWEELSVNKGLFENLCRSLIANGEILVLRNVKTAHLQDDSFYAFFPETASAVISPLVYSEIALPFEHKPFPLSEPISSELTYQIAALPCLDHWNPLIHAPNSAKIGQLLNKIEK